MTPTEKLVTEVLAAVQFPKVPPARLRSAESSLLMTRIRRRVAFELYFEHGESIQSIADIIGRKPLAARLAIVKEARRRGFMVHTPRQLFPGKD